MTRTRINQKAVQTGEPRGHFTAGDPHPTEAGLVYKQCQYGREKWQTLAQAKRVAQQNSAHYKANTEKCKNRVVAWQAANPGVVNHNTATRKARALNQAPALTESERDACAGTYAQMQRLNKTFGKGTWEVDHTRPLALGGLHDPSNLQIVPAKWNTSKGSKHSNRWEAPYEG
jgi:hypothetical protein